MFNVDELRNHIEALLREYPDLADDELLRADMLSGETNIEEVLTELFRTGNRSAKMVEVQTKELADLKTRRSRFERRVEFLRELMLRVLQSANLKKIELPLVTLSQRNPPPQVIGEVDADALPDDLVRIIREPNKTAIREALLEGREVPGLVLSNSPPALTVRAK
jgi:hypothetical protein